MKIASRAAHSDGEQGDGCGSERARQQQVSEAVASKAAARAPAVMAATRAAAGRAVLKEVRQQRPRQQQAMAAARAVLSEVRQQRGWVRQQQAMAASNIAARSAANNAAAAARLAVSKQGWAVSKAAARLASDGSVSTSQNGAWNLINSILSSPMYRQKQEVYWHSYSKILGIFALKALEKDPFIWTTENVHPVHFNMYILVFFGLSHYVNLIVIAPIDYSAVSVANFDHSQTVT